VAALLGLLAGAPIRAAAQDSYHIMAGGQLRVQGVAFDNIRDFKDSRDGRFRDNESFYLSRFRLFLVNESLDWKARVVWAVEVGDIIWGDGGGASGDEYGTGTNARFGFSRGGGLGADGANVETKNLYVRFELPNIPHAQLRLGAAPFRFLPGARLPMFSADLFSLCACLDDRPLPADVVFSEFTSDDVFQVQLDWQLTQWKRGYPDIDVQLMTGKAFEGLLPSADDVDLYMARVGVLATDDLYLSLEGLIINQQDLAGGRFGDTFWVGGSVRWEHELSDAGRLYVGVTGVYGQRAIKADTGATCGGPTQPCREAGFGVVAWLQGRTYDWIVTGAGWYTSGDDQRSPRTRTNEALKNNSDRLPVPIAEKSWNNPPLIAEWVLSTSWLGAPELGQSRYMNLSGTFGTGISVQRRLRWGPGFAQAGVGLGFVGATGAPDVADTRTNTGGWGRLVVEADAGVIYRLHSVPTLSLRGLIGYMVPERDDPAWALGFLTQLDF
jgi:hypothetical protein